MWDWIYTHHSSMVGAFTAAAGSGLAVLGWAWRRRQWGLAVLCLGPAVAAAALLAGWIAADQRSNQRDIATRVAQVVGVLPTAAKRIGDSAGDNFRTSTYSLSSEPPTAVQELSRSIAQLTDGDVSGPESGPGHQIVVSFRSRNGSCDGTVEVALTTSGSLAGGSLIEINGYCED